MVENESQVPDNKKLRVIFRIEPGSLGPDGMVHIETFCGFVQNDLAHLDSEFIFWEVAPRYDKLLPEIEYTVGGKRLSHEKAAMYMTLFEKHLEEFEIHLGENISRLIEEFLNR